MQRGSEPVGEGQERRGISRWAAWSRRHAVIPLGLALAGSALFLAATLLRPTVGSSAGATGTDRSVGTPPAAAVAPEGVSPDAAELTATAAESSLPTAALAEEGTRASDGELAIAGSAQAASSDEVPSTELGLDDVRSRERPSFASRGGFRAPEPTPDPTPAPREEVVTYRVVEGDTVSSLAQRFGVSPQTIVRANDLEDPEHLGVGQELTILPISGVRHVVQDGDTLLALAERYGVIPEELVAVNHLAAPDQLSVGQTLLVPEVSAEKLAASVAPEADGKPLRPTSYTVAPGDTLFGIASRFGLSVETLQWANADLGSLDQLSVGQQLLVPPVDGTLHRVQEGDTVSGVAALHGASAADLVRANGLAEPYLLSLGQLLVIPGGRPLPSTPPSAPKAETAPTAVPAPAGQVTPTPRPQPTPRPTATPLPPKPTPQPTAPPPPAPAAAPAPALEGGAGGRIVEVAMQYRGTRYTWGGTSPKTGFDCSGFVWYVYRQAGVPVPRDLWGQLNSGARVGRDNLQPGDVVFFQNTYKAGLSHDGIYVGGGQFIHAASENTGVIVSSLSESYWAARYLGATRPY